MSGPQPNTWKTKKKDMPTTNPFWANINQEGGGPISKTATDQVSQAESEGTKKEDKQKSAKKIKKCYKCGADDHTKKFCPNKGAGLAKISDNVDDKSEQAVEQGKSVENPTKQSQRNDDLRTSIKCHICNTQGEHSTAACPKHPLNKNQKTEAKPVVDKPAENIKQENKCAYCDVEGHLIQNCPVKNWGKGPGAESASEDKGKSSKDMAAKPATPNITLLAEQKQPASTTTNVEKPLPGKPIPIRTAATQELTIKQQKEMTKRQKRIEEHKTLYKKMLHAQMIINANTTKQARRNMQSAGIPRMSSAAVPNIPQPIVSSIPSAGVPNISRPIAPIIPSASVPNIASLPNVQYPGFPTMPVKRGPIPVTIINHPNAAVQIPVPSGQVNNPGPTRTFTSVTDTSVPTDVNQPNTSSVNMMHRFNTIRHFPAGVPKSFLAKDYRENMQQYEMHRMALKEKEMALKYVNKVPELVHSTNDSGNIFEMVPDPNEVAKIVPIQSEESMDADPPKAYSPSEVYGDMKNESGSTEPHEGSESPDPHGQKRLSAFQRLGPVTAPKKPKLTINLRCNAEEPFREVVNETEEEYVEEHTPVHLRKDITTSTDETVMKYLLFWPWKKYVPPRRTATFKHSKSAMLLEQEQMEESYDKDNAFIQITITNYPRNWTKEDVIDVLLEQVNIIPCFIEFTSKECKFLVIRSKAALLAIHKMGFRLRKENLELHLSISLTVITQNQIDFLPRLVLRRRLNMVYDGEKALDLQEFTLKSDLSHFIYFPLNRISHQADLVQLQSVVDWERLTELNLSHNRLTSIEGFHLNSTTPNLKKLDLSYNYFEKVITLLRCRNLPLKSISLEGNPLCHDYTDPAEYVKVVRMLFPAIRELDGVTIHLKGDLPSFKKNFCLYGAENIVEKFLETFYPLLEAPPTDRVMIDEMYDENALLTVLYRYKFIHRQFRISSINSHFVDEGLKDVVEGASSIMKYVNKWPGLKHDPFTFTVDVLYHTDTATLVKICGILKLTSDTLAEDEPVISFTRTTLLHTTDGVEYKILNEMLLFDEPSNECHDNAFQVTKIRSRKLYIDLEFETTPDDESKKKLIAIFSHLTELDKNASRRCLERKEWNLKSALDNFIQLLKLNDLSPLINAPTCR